jgi:hypothetical protein
VVTSNILIPVWRQKRKPLHRFVVRWRFHQNWSNTECLIAWHNCKVTVTLSRYSGMYVTIPYVSVADFWLPAREMLSHAYLHAPHAKGSIVQRGVNQHLPVIRLIPPSLSALSLSVGGSPPALFLFWQCFSDANCGNYVAAHLILQKCHTTSKNSYNAAPFGLYSSSSS